MAKEEARVPPAAVAKTAGGNSAFRNVHNDFAHIADPTSVVVLPSPRSTGLLLASITFKPVFIIYYPAIAGTVVGHLVFELIIIIFATLAQALTGGSLLTSLIGIIIFWRVLMGIGISGDYPLSSIITSKLTWGTSDRLTIPETPCYTFDIACDIKKANEDVKAYMTGRHEGETDEVARAQVHQGARKNL
ncbi:hypothetical protein ACKAV7_015184 [Fusarium commune]